VLAVSCGYAFQLFYNEIKKFITISKFLSTGKTIKSIDELHEFNRKNKTKTALKNHYVMIEGEAEKYLKRSGDYISSDIILSKAYSTYYEDFLLKLSGGKVLVQPYPKTTLCYLPKDYIGKSGIVMSYLRLLLFKESEVLKNTNKIFIFGEINNDRTYVPDDPSFSQFLNIKPKLICGGSEEDFTYAIKSTHLTQSFFYLIGFTICTFGCIYQFKKNVLPLFRKLKTIIKKRFRSVCKECNVNPSNVLCENCENVCDVCDVCYSDYQNKLNNREISLNSIRCPSCKQVLKSAQKLLME